MANTYLSRTLSGSSSREQWTFSAWVKISGNPTGSYGYLFSCTDAANHTARISIMNNNVAKFGFVDSLISTDVQTNRLLRDNNSWYHLMVVLDTTLSTASDRVKLYVNGVRETSLANTSYPSVNAGGLINYVGGSYRHNIGSYNNGSSNFFNGIMSHVHFADGAMLAPTVFGETDATTGAWKIKVDPTFTPGTNGFSILMNGNTITDQSAGSNNWSLGGGTLTKTEDCPDNVFATMNSLDKNVNAVLTNGNNSLSTTNNGNWVNACKATLGIGSGKFYWEMKITGSGTSNGYFFGICADTVNLKTSSGIQDTSAERAKGLLLFCDDGQYQLDTNSRQSMTSGAALNDVLGCAVDRDNNNVKFFKNGSQVGSIDISSSPLATCSHIMPFTIGYYTALQLNHNFGNGYFGTSAISSQGASASTPGIFEHDCPSGFQPLSTKGLNA